MVLSYIRIANGCCVHECEDNPGSRTDTMGCFPEFPKMAETNRPAPLLIPAPEGDGFEAGEERDWRHGSKPRLRLVRRGVFSMPDWINLAPIRQAATMASES
jgi:hypothetical protein